jgi:hypothetical protein
MPRGCGAVAVDVGGRVVNSEAAWLQRSGGHGACLPRSPGDAGGVEPGSRGAWSLRWSRTRRPGLPWWSPQAWRRRGRSVSRPTAQAIGSSDASPQAARCSLGDRGRGRTGRAAGRASTCGRDHSRRCSGEAGPTRRLPSTGHGRKSDPACALSVGIAAWSAPALRTVEIDQAIAALRR